MVELVTDILSNNKFPPVSHLFPQLGLIFARVLHASGFHM